MDFAEVAEDLVLLSVDWRGHVAFRYRYKLDLALSALELAALEAAWSVRIVADPRLAATTRDSRRLILTDPDWPPPGPAELQAALAGITRMEYPPMVWQWLGAARDGLVTGYLERLAASGATERRARVRPGRTVTRWPVTDWRRLTTARSRLTALARSQGEASQADALYAGLARAMKLPLPAALRSRQARHRLKEISASCWLNGVVAARIRRSELADKIAAVSG